MVRRPSDPTRFAVLGLADSDPNGKLAANASTGDVLAYGLVPRGALDPVDGILEGVRAEVEVLRLAMSESPLAEVLEMLSRRIYTAKVLLQRADGCERIPEVEPLPEDEPEDGAPAKPEAEATTTPVAAAAPTVPEDSAPAVPLDAGLSTPPDAAPPTPADVAPSVTVVTG